MPKYLFEYSQYLGLYGIRIFNADRLELMDSLISEGAKFDMILCDLPYGKTKNTWDCVIPLNELWMRYDKLIYDNGDIVLFGQDKFSAKLMLSNEKQHRYNLIWEKTSPTGHLNSKRMPLRSHEDILIFYKSLPIYNPQKTSGHVRKVSSSAHKRNSKKTTNYGEHKSTSYDSTERYPKSVWKYSLDKQKSSLHPTQKPVLLLEELIKTYTKTSSVVLDNCIGSGSTAVAALNTGRGCIGIEKDKNIYEDAVSRVNELVIKKRDEEFGYNK